MANNYRPTNHSTKMLMTIMLRSMIRRNMIMMNNNHQQFKRRSLFILNSCPFPSSSSSSSSRLVFQNNHQYRSFIVNTPSQQHYRLVNNYWLQLTRTLSNTTTGSKSEDIHGIYLFLLIIDLY